MDSTRQHLSLTAKKEAPTIFNIGSTSDCAEYDKYIYDLKDSEIYKHLTDKHLHLSTMARLHQ